MTENKITQHVQLPNNMVPLLEPQDLLVYVSIKRYMNNETKESCPSLQTISDNCGASIPTIRKRIKNLENKKYIETKKIGRKQYYRFLKYTNFEPFSYEFLDNQNLTFQEKAYQLAAQQYQFKEDGYGKLSLTNKELSEKINMPESTISKCNRSLMNKGYLDIVQTRKQNSGIIIKEKFFHLDEFGQAVVFELQKQREDIDKNTENIEKLQEEVNSLKKDLKIVLSENKKLKQEKEEKEKLEKMQNPIMN